MPWKTYSRTLVIQIEDIFTDDEEETPPPPPPPVVIPTTVWDLAEWEVAPGYWLL